MLVCETSCSEPDTFVEQPGDDIPLQDKRRRVHKKRQGRLYMQHSCQLNRFEYSDDIRLTGEQGEALCGGQCKV